MAGKSDVLPRYFKELRKCMPLSAQKEKEVGFKARAGDTEAINLLVVCNLKYAFSVAKEYQGQGIPLEDLVNDASEGMMEAAKRFDPRVGVKFISYADHWIRQSIMAAIKDTARIIRLPRNIQHDYTLIKKIRDKLTSEIGEFITDADISQRIRHLTPNTVTEVLKETSTYTASLDDPIGDKDDTRVSVYVPKIQELSKDEVEIIKLKAKTALSVLPSRDREIVKMFYGIGKEFPVGNEVIANTYNMTTTNVNVILRKSIRIMKSFMVRKKNLKC